jgi:hypothetical protein
VEVKFVKTLHSLHAIGIRYLIAILGSIGMLVSYSLIAKAADPVLVGAGDIASCSSLGDEATAKLLDGIPGTVFTAGDNAYPNGTATEFANCYDPTWGRHKARTRPAPGNHDYYTPGASGYYNYFGAAAGDPTKGYYSYNLGAWHVVVLNSNISMAAGSPQERWLRADLAAHPAACTVAYWHHPRFSSGYHGNDSSVHPIWQALYDYGADVVLNGHDHNYERFAPQDPSGKRDTVRGIREFVVGMGGATLRAFRTIQPNSEVRNSDTRGVLKLTLHPTSYSWQFIPEAGKSFSDTGNAPCVSSTAPSPSPTATASPTPTNIPSASNLLKNASFELDANGDNRPDNWTSNSKFTRSSAVVHAGSYAGRFRATDNSGATIFQTVPQLTAGTTYTFADWVNIPSTSDSFTFKLQVRWRNASNNTIRTDTIKSYTDDTKGTWNEVRRSLVAPAGTTSAQVRMVVSSLNATVYVDDFVFQPQ